MKKFLFALMALPLMTAFTSCSDDDDVPDVDIKLEFAATNTVINNEVYVVKPEDIQVVAVKVTSNIKDQNAGTSNVSYFLDGYPMGTNYISPYGINIPTKDLDPGTYNLAYSLPVFQENHSIGSAAGGMKIHVVADAADIPSTGGDDGGDSGDSGDSGAGQK